MSQSEFERLRAELVRRYLVGEIDKATYDQMLAQLEQLRAGQPSGIDESEGIYSHGAEPTLYRPGNSASGPRACGPGTELGGFRLESKIARGGMGEVWKAWDLTAKRHVVIKLVPPELQHNDEEMGQVEETFRHIHALQHEHICPVYLLGRDPWLGYFIVMKYIEGQTLSAYRKQYVAERGSLPLMEAVRLLAPVAEALDYAHGCKVVHRDVKPQNILVVGQGVDVQVVDFGLAAQIRTSCSHVSQVQMDSSGTYPYMAPEQWRGEYQDGSTDQYALAVVAYEFLAGHLPFCAAATEMLRFNVLQDLPPPIDDLPGAANAVLLRGLAKKRADRFSSCREFVKALQAATTKPASVPEKVAPQPALAEVVKTPVTTAAGGPAIKTAPPVAPAEMQTSPPPKRFRLVRSAAPRVRLDSRRFRSPPLVTFSTKKYYRRRPLS